MNWKDGGGASAKRPRGGEEIAAKEWRCESVFHLSCCLLGWGTTREQDWGSTQSIVVDMLVLLISVNSINYILLAVYIS